MAYWEALCFQGCAVNALKLIALLACQRLFYIPPLSVLAFGQRHESN